MFLLFLKMFVRNIRFIIFFVLLLSSVEGWSYLRSDVDLGLGPISLDIKTSDLTKKLTSAAGLEFNYNLIHEAYNAAYCFSFYEVGKTDEGYLSFTRFAIGAKFYPTGLIGRKVILDNEVEAKLWKASPYMGLFLGISNTSVKEYNASAFDITPRVGVEIPVTAKLIMITQFEIFSSLSQGVPSSGAKNFNYTGFGAMLGIRITSFE